MFKDTFAKGKYFSPVILLFPYVLYIILYGASISIQYILAIVLIVCIISELVSRYILKDWLFRRAFGIVAASFLITLISWFFLHSYMIDPHAYYIILEIWLIFSLLIMRKKGVLFDSKKQSKDILKMNLIEDFHNLNQIVSYACLGHVLIIVIYKYIEDSDLVENESRWNFFLFIVLPFIFIFSSGIYEFLKERKLLKKLSEETWLPIVNDNGDVTGRIAQSVLKEGEGLEYCYPVVRVVLICKDKIYLQSRTDDDLFCPGKLDHPFENFIYFGHKIEETVDRKLHILLGSDFDISNKKYIMKYKFENEYIQRLIFLFCLKVNEESEINDINKLSGKFWSLEEIEDAFTSEILSENFELEYEYLKNTVL